MDVDERPIDMVATEPFLPISPVPPFKTPQNNSRNIQQPIINLLNTPGHPP